MAEIEQHFHFHGSPDFEERVERKLDHILRKLQRIDEQEFTLTINTQALLDAATAESSVEASVLTLLTDLHDQLADEPAAQAAIDQVTQELTANASGLAAALTANTPAAPPADTPPADTPPADNPVVDGNGNPLETPDPGASDTNPGGSVSS